MVKQYTLRSSIFLKYNILYIVPLTLRSFILGGLNTEQRPWTLLLFLSDVSMTPSKGFCCGIFKRFNCVVISLNVIIV